MTFPVPALPSSPVKKRRTDLIPARWQQALIVPVALIIAMVLVQIANTFDGDWLTRNAGIRPRTVDGLVGIVTAPFVHGGWGHLLSNAVPFLIFGFLVMVNGARQFIAVTVVVWLISGLGVWVVGGSGSVVVGASGIVFGWLAYLVVRGAFNRNAWQIVVGLVLLAGWGSIFWGVLPGANQISWQAHLFGALGGVLAAFLAARGTGARRPKPKPALPAGTL